MIPDTNIFKKRAIDYEGWLFGGTYDNSWMELRKKAGKDHLLPRAGTPGWANRKAELILRAREDYNSMRKEIGLPEITDWSKRPKELIQHMDLNKPIVSLFQRLVDFRLGYRKDPAWLRKLE